MTSHGQTQRIRWAHIALAAVFVLSACSSSGSAGGWATLRPVGVSVPQALDEHAPTVVNFWATTCVSCKTELRLLQAQGKHPGVRLIGVDLGDDAGQISAALADAEVTFDQYIDVDGSASTAAGVVSLPTTVVVSADGRVIDRHVGALSAEVLGKLLAKAASSR